MFGITSISQQGSCCKNRARVEFTFTRGFSYVSEAAFTKCGNPSKVFSTDFSDRNQLSVLIDQHDFNNFCNLSRLISKKGGFTPVLANHKKDFFH